MGKKILSVINFIVSIIPLAAFGLLAIALIFFEGAILDFDKMIGVFVAFGSMGGMIHDLWPFLYIPIIISLLLSILLYTKMLEWKKFNKITLSISILNIIITGLSLLIAIASAN